jgi:hypothetical protein
VSLASATGVELPTTYVHATSSVVQPFIPLNAFVHPVGQVTEFRKAVVLIRLTNTSPDTTPFGIVV